MTTPGPPLPLPTALTRVGVDLGQIGRNWDRLQALAGPTKMSAVVKANAYGLGLTPVVRTLLKRGCDVFFTAHLSEALVLRQLTGRATIYVLNGLIKADIPLYLANAISPVLCSPQQLSDWVALAPGAAAALHVDTGINRLGLSVPEAHNLAANSPTGLKLSLVMSHLAAADDPDHPLNALQLQRFQDIATAFAGIPASLANSHGLVSIPESRSDLARPGIALFGGGPALFKSPQNPSVVRFEAKVLQTRSLQAGDAVGYGATAIVSRPSDIALVAAGYADGYPRLQDPSRVQAAINGHLAPLIGAVSMDMLAIDITDLPTGLVRPGDWVELIGPHAHLEPLAAAAGTISYDILTKLGRRSDWTYVD